MAGNFMSMAAGSGGNTIRFSEHKATSRAFSALYDEGMALVEETADYLDSEGRAEAKRLGRVAATLYAAESMRLTTRLMQLASWLLLQRALNNGEMTPEQVESEKGKIHLETQSPNTNLDAWNELPDHFCELVRRSLRLQSRVRRLDKAQPHDDEISMSEDNPVNAQVNLLRTAFGTS